MTAYNLNPPPDTPIAMQRIAKQVRAARARVIAYAERIRLINAARYWKKRLEAAKHQDEG